MDFVWFNFLWLLAVLPLMVALYVVLLRRKKRAALRYANLGLVKEAQGVSRFRRHVPPLLFLLATAVALLAVARPQALITLPSQRSTLILAMDVSGSMRADDVAPNRITAAQQAARAFVEQQPKDVRLGLVAYAGSAFLVQSPTFERASILEAIDRFQTQRGTNIGEGLLVSLQAIFPDADFGVGRGVDFRDRASASIKAPEEKKEENFIPVQPGSYKSAAIILMTDGQPTTGPDPVMAARKAAERGVRVFTVGFGSPNGNIVGYGGYSMRVQIDEDLLKQVADITRGSYFQASNGAELTKVYKTLNNQFVMEKTKTEVTAVFAAIGAALLFFAGVLSFLWFGRLV